MATGHPRAGVGPSPAGRCVVGLCGGIGAGKSTGSALLRAWGAEVCDVDALGHAVLGPGQPALQQVVHRFGPGVVDANGSLDRRALGALVFSDPEQLAALNAIAHPPMVAALDVRLATWRQAKASPAVFVVDAALLFDMGLDRRCDETLAVTAQPAVQVARLAASRGLDLAEAKVRVAAQAAVALWDRRATTVIDNNGTLGEFAATLAGWWRELARRHDLALTDPDRPT